MAAKIGASEASAESHRDIRPGLFQISI